MRTVGHFVNGVEVMSEQSAVINQVDPVTEESVASVQIGGELEVDAAVTSSAEASLRWRREDPCERSHALWRLADLLEQNHAELASLDCRDVGKPIADCREDVRLGTRLMRFFAGMADKVYGDTFSVEQGYHAFTLREPYGTIGAIIPWNFPVYSACLKVGAILAMGNTCVLKPAEQSPSSALALAALAMEAGLPPGALNVVCGGPETGQLLAAHMLVDKVTFTGSTSAGRQVLQSAALSNLKPCTLELGGKASALVFADADIAAAAEGIALSVFFNQGQSCTATTRIFVDEMIVDNFIDDLVQRAARLRIGDPMDQDTQLGPLVTFDQLQSVEGYVSDGVRTGGRLLCGGKRPARKGYFFEPTIIRDPDIGSPLMTEETFGPVACINTFRSEEEAIRLGNSTSYGLAASVWTRDAGQLQRAAEELVAGVVWGNCSFVEHPSVPFGGFKASGFGKDYGMAAGLEYSRSKSVWLRTAPGFPVWT